MGLDFFQVGGEGGRIWRYEGHVGGRGEMGLVAAWCPGNEEKERERDGRAWGNFCRDRSFGIEC